uniref:Ig-like domain-containing protein n=1 Tax=Parastrongyloides trichosuri TaxID=131310 RepID=A0A0N4Z4U8_PARTI
MNKFFICFKVLVIYSFIISINGETPKDFSNRHGNIALRISGRRDESQSFYETKTGDSTATVSVPITLNQRNTFLNLKIVNVDMSKFKNSDGVFVRMYAEDKNNYATYFSVDRIKPISVKVDEFKAVCSYHTCDAGIVMISKNKIRHISEIKILDIIYAFYLAYSNGGNTYIAREVETNKKTPYLFECPGGNWVNPNAGIIYKADKSSATITDNEGKENPAKRPKEWYTNLQDSKNKIVERTYLTPLLPDEPNSNIKTCNTIYMVNDIKLSWGYELKFTGKPTDSIIKKNISELETGLLNCEVDGNAVMEQIFSISFQDTILNDGKGRYFYNHYNQPSQYFHNQKIMVYKYDSDIKQRYINGEDKFSTTASSIKPTCAYNVIPDVELPKKSIKFIPENSDFASSQLQLENGRRADVLYIKAKDFSIGNKEKQIKIGCFPYNSGAKDKYKNYYINSIQTHYYGAIDKTGKIDKTKKMNNGYVKIIPGDFQFFGLYKCHGMVGSTELKDDESDYFLILPDNEVEFQKSTVDSKGALVQPMCAVKYETVGELKRLSIASNDIEHDVEINDIGTKGYFEFDDSKSNVKLKGNVAYKDVIVCEYETYYRHSTFKVVMNYNVESAFKANGIAPPNFFTANWPYIVSGLGCALLLIISGTVGYVIVKRRRARRRAMSCSSISISRSTNSVSNKKSRASKSSTKKSGIESLKSSSNKSSRSVNNSTSKSAKSAKSMSKKKPSN